MMLHREGYGLVFKTFLALALLHAIFYYLYPTVLWGLVPVSLVVLALVLQFFRNPTRTIEVADDGTIYAPCDGKIVVIEETVETEYFKDKRLQISIFMSPLNVHVNRNPIGGVIKYFKYHAGLYLVAWHPKSSTENERTSIVIGNDRGEILLRQIAGAVARRIICYIKQDETVQQGSELGFIKFGSRVDLFLPLNAQVQVKINDIAKGNKTIIAKF